MTATSRMLAAAILTAGAYAAGDSAAPGRRLSPPEIASIAHTGAGTGTSGVSGIETRVLQGDPTRAGLYTIQLRVPANTRIEAHDHPDDRVGTVVEGTWHFGYGERFDEKDLKALPPGSFYAEPPNDPHFARTGSSAVTLHITGFGPSGTRFLTAAPGPARSRNPSTPTSQASQEPAEAR